MAISEERQLSILNSQLSILAKASWAVFRKDVRAELRTRYALNALALFAVSTVVAISLGVGPLTRSADLPLIHAALLWIAILFAAFTGLARAFVQEEEARTAAALRLAAPPNAVYLTLLSASPSHGALEMSKLQLAPDANERVTLKLGPSAPPAHAARASSGAAISQAAEAISPEINRVRQRARFDAGLCHRFAASLFFILPSSFVCPPNSFAIPTPPPAAAASPRRATPSVQHRTLPLRSTASGTSN